MVFKKNEFFKENNFDLIIKIKNPLIKNNGKMKTDSNGFFTMNRKKTNSFEKSVFPFTSFVKIINDNESEISTSVFNDRSQGVINDEEGSLMVYLQRTTSEKSHDEILTVNKSFFVDFSILNTQKESDWDLEYFDLVNKKDIHLFKGFFKSKKYNSVLNKKNKLNNKKKKNIENNKKLDLDLENSKKEKKTTDQYFTNNFRINIDFINKDSFLIRLQSLNKKKTLKISSDIFLYSFFGDLDFKAISFDYIFSDKPENPKEVDLIITLKPLEFKTFLAKIKYN